MKILIAEDDFISRKILFEVLSPFGTCDLTIDGIEAIDAFILALDGNQPYNLVCLDIMMPRVDGLKVLKAIRDIERQRGIKNGDMSKIIMTSALSDTNGEYEALSTGNEAYAVKPIDRNYLKQLMHQFKLL